MRLSWILGILFVSLMKPVAGLDLLPAKPITHRLQVQPIRAIGANGELATMFGNSTIEPQVKARINQIWAQAGVEIEFLPPVDYNSPFAYNGYPTDYSTVARPIGDLNLIRSGAGTPPKNADVKVINLFFVEISPGFNQVGEATANGLAFVDRNGVTMHVGDLLLNPALIADGLDIIAQVIAHEIGHNLGLEHSNNNEHLMYSGGPIKQHITAAEIAIIFDNHPVAIDGADFLQEIVSSNYDIWVTDNGITGGDTGDHDNDGTPNIVEFALGMNSTESDCPPEPYPYQGGLRIDVPKTPEALADGFTYSVFIGSSLPPSTLSGATGSQSTVLVDDSQSLDVSINTAGYDRRFMRISIDRPGDVQGTEPANSSTPTDGYQLTGTLK